jgi:hypothetical protein
LGHWISPNQGRDLWLHPRAPPAAAALSVDIFRPIIDACQSVAVLPPE